jgi:death-on-curing protein
MFGGARGLRDEGLLDSALARPRNVRAYRPKATIPELTAAYAYGIAKNHPFVDGNKRAAFLAMGLFLAINGHRLSASPVDAIETILSIAEGTMEEEPLSQWVAQNIKRGSS